MFAVNYPNAKRLPACPVSSCKAAARSAVVLRLQRQLMAQEAVKDSPYPARLGVR
jgi:hypothetical protein